jgi:carotenoid 1,2-hydratase
VCLNVATYGPGGRFTMTDRGRSALRQSPDVLTIGPSSMRWSNGQLLIDVDEWSAPPRLSRVRGRIRVTPSAITTVEAPLSASGAHVWRPFAPVCGIEVDLEAQGWQWLGHGYFDANFGSRPLEDDFTDWTWARFPTADGCTCFYDAARTDGGRTALAVRFGWDGTARPVTAPPVARLPRTRWLIRRQTRADAGYAPQQVQNLLDTPFYSRSAVRTRIDGEETLGVHEALDLRRYRSPLVKPMLAMRVPRRAEWHFD